ncbi:MAG: thiamine pyrophosphate-dependent enzyme, partial [Planctomycetota bacterium]
LVTHLRAAGLEVEGKPEDFRFGELNVGRVRAILEGQTEEEEDETPAGRAPRLCPGCPHRKTFEVLDEQDAIVTGDIGCYTLGALGPFRSMDTQLCMGASIGMGLGLRHVLPEEEARRVVSVIGDSTFVHSGLTGLVEAVYNTPPTGHTIIVVDNGTTAMTGLQEHPATGKLLDGTPTEQLSIEGVAESVGISEVKVIDPLKETDKLSTTLWDARDNDVTTLIVARRSCVLAQKKARRREKEEAEANA